jgi:hypothetical protein
LTSAVVTTIVIHAGRSPTPTSFPPPSSTCILTFLRVFWAYDGTTGTAKIGSAIPTTTWKSRIKTAMSLPRKISMETT